MSIKSPQVSVIVLATNKNKYLLKTITSVQQQTFSDFEILICHNGDSPQLVKWWNKQPDSRIKLLFQDDSNPIRTLNSGIEAAQGEYIAFLQADDLWHPNKLKKQVFHLEHYPAIGLIHSWLTLVDERQKPLGKIIKNQLHGWVESGILERNRIGFSSVIIRRHCLYLVGLFSPSLKTNYDWDMWIRLSRCYQFMTIAEALVYHRQRQDRAQDSWLETEQDFHITIERAYQDVAAESQYLKASSYAYASLDLAWQVLHHQNPDPEIAYHYCRQALEYSPRISFTQEFFQLSLEIITLHYLISDHYLLILASIKTIRHWLHQVIERFKALAHLLLYWTLQETGRGKGSHLGHKKRGIRNQG